MICLCRLGGVRAHKADGDADIKYIVEQIVIDVFLVHCTPEWPAALPMLLRLITALHSKAGMHCADNAVRQIAVDLLGFIASQLCYEARRADLDMPAVEEILQEAGMSPNGRTPTYLEQSQHLLCSLHFTLVLCM